MKKLLLVLGLMAGACAAEAQMQPATVTSLSIGASLPQLTQTFRSTDNQMVSMQSIKTGKGLLVMFSCNTCPYVIKSQKRTREMLAYAQKNGLGVVVVNSNEAQRDNADSYEEMKKYAKAQGYRAPYIVDNGPLVSAFGATRTPEVFLFDGSGKLVYKGAMEDNPTDPAQSKQLYLKSAIDNMLQGRPVNPGETKSIGCTIKRAG